MMLRRFFFLPVILCLLYAIPVQGQISIPALSTPYTENFNSIGTAALATTPANWRISRSSSARILGTWAAGLTATTHTAGNNMSSTASNGMYNYAAGDPASATDRGLGFLSSSSGTVSGNIMGWYRNTTGGDIGSLSVGYQIEKYRTGSNSAGFFYTLYYSTDGSTWTAVPTSTVTFPADAANGGYASAPGLTVPVSVTVTFTSPIPNNGDFYLQWLYSVVSGTSGSNSQGLGIDDVSITAAAPAPTLPTYVQFGTASSSFGENAGLVSIPVTIANPSATTATTVEVALTTGGTATNGSDVQPAFVTQTLTFPANSSASQSATFTIFDDTVFEGDETLVFTLQNVSGGTTASAGVPSSHTVTIIENDSPPMPDVVVNEYFNSNGDISTFEAVELYVVRDGLDMRGWSVADATSGGTYPFGVVTFSNDPLWASLQAGTIILIGGTFSVPVEDLDPADGRLMLRAPAGGQSTQYFTAGSSVPSIAAASDGVAVRDALGGFVHGLAHGTSNQNTFPSGRRGWISGSVLSGQSVGFTRTGAAMSTMDFLNDAFAAFVTLSLGEPNDADGNRAALRTLRSRTITASRNLAGTFFWDVTVTNGATVTLTAPVNIGGTLSVLNGTLNENSRGLSADAAGNAQNGTGTGAVLIGDGAGLPALLQYVSTPGTVSGGLNASQTDATVEYRGTAAQAVIPATYHALVLLNGGTGARKTLAAPATVNGTLSIGSGAWFDVASPHIVTLGAAGTFVNAGRFLGSIRTTRTLSVLNTAESFGGIGATMTPTAGTLPGATTVTMTSGTYVWVGNLPSILKRYTIQPTATGGTVTLVTRYETVDLNGQIENGLQLQYSSNAGSTWSQPGGTLNTTQKTLTLSTTQPGGLWTAHANPPQGVIVPAPAALTFTTERNFTPLPASQNVSVANANGQGSIIEWSASATTVLTPTWLSITPNPATGVNSGSFSVSVTRNDMPAGIYTGSIIITDPRASNSPVTIPVSYNVQAPRLICVGADTIVIAASYKKGNPKKAVAVLNCGGAFGSDVILWTASTSSSWLSISPTSGSEGETFTITADIFGFQPGSYFGEVTITGTHSVRGTPIANSPLTLPVRVEVQDGAAVSGNITNPVTGVTRSIYNQYGHRIASVKVTSGTVTSITVHAHPGELPPGITRLRYANRYYTFDVTGSNYTIDVTMYYTSGELGAMLITNPQDLRAWRQYPKGGVWYATPSTASAIENSVTITGATNLDGNWAMAVPYFPVAMPLRALSARWDARDDAVVEWSSDLRTAPCGFLVERSAAGSGAWAIIGTVDRSSDGLYRFPDRLDDRQAWSYRLLTIDESGTAYESSPVILHPRSVTSTDAPAAAGTFALRSTMPHPVRSGTPAVLPLEMDREAHAVVTLHDALGRTAATLHDGLLARGRHAFVVPARDLAPGSYLCMVRSDGRTLVRSIVITR